MHRCAFLLVVMSAIVLGGTVSSVSGADAPEASAGLWPQFLGPERNGLSRETGLNVDWRARPPKTLWKVPLGLGFSSMSFAGDRLFTMCERDKRQYVVCLDTRTGKEVWSHDAAPGYLDRQRHGAGPRSTPTHEKGRLYCLLPAGELLCLKASDGKPIWKTNVFEVTGAGTRADQVYYWGMSGSPLVEGEQVIVQPGGNQGNSVAAFHKDNGKLVWKAGDDPPSYASPIAVTVHGRRHVVCFTGNSLLGLDPAGGKVLWRFPWANNFDTNCAQPIWSDNKFFISTAYGPGCSVLEIVAEGDRLAAREKWQSKQLQNHFGTSIILDGHIYGCHGDLGANMLRCFELATGKEKWTAREPGKCTLIAAERHLICLSDHGTVRLLEADSAKYTLKGELKDVLTYKAWTPPALYNRKLYLRDQKVVVCIDLSRE